MSNDLTKPNRSELAPSVQQDAQKIFNIDTIKQFTNQPTQIFTSTGLPGTPGYKATPLSFSRDYYNLIVYGQEPMLADGHITYEKKRCLVEDDNIAPELKAKYSPLTPEIIEELKTFPCILASENHHAGWTDDNHFASFAQLVEVKNRSNGIELYYHPLFGIPQKRINELIFEFGICGKYRHSNELNHSHWSIKAIDLYEVLSEASLFPF